MIASGQGTTAARRHVEIASQVMAEQLFLREKFLFGLAFWCNVREIL